MIDTHAHLDSCATSPGEVIAQARAAGVTEIVTIGSGIESCRESLAIAEQHQGVRCALGIHPHQAADVSDGDFAALRELLAHPLAVAVGETGFDFYRDHAPSSVQEEAFRVQIELARELDKPLVVHSRSADDSTLALLLQYGDTVTVILHCLSSERLAQATVDHGYYGSFAGNVSFPKAEELRRAAQIVPADRLLAETDAPYLAPQPVRGRPNEPRNVTHVYDALAAARGEAIETCARAIDANARRVFSL